MKTTGLKNALLQAAFFASVPLMFLVTMYTLNGVLPVEKDNTFSVRETVLGPLTKPLPEFTQNH